MLRERLKKRELLATRRRLTIRPELIDFASNDTLGLARSALLANAVREEWENHQGNLNGLGATGARLLSGNSLYAEELEEHIAAFHGYRTGLLFNCGFMANLGLLSAIASSRDLIFYDVRVHASTRMGIRLSSASAFPFKHNDLNHLEERLQQGLSAHKRFICIESIYSTDGSRAPLRAICQLAARYDAQVILDEAHATGIYGPEGRGLAAEAQVTDAITAHVVTFGKGLGTFGAIVLGSRLLKEALLNFSIPSIYTTALPFQLLAAIKCSYDLFPRCHQERQIIQQLAQQCGSASHIQAVPIQGSAAVRALSEKLAEAGYDVRPLVSPTVRRGEESLRLCLHSYNSEKELRELENLIAQERGKIDE